MDIIHIHGFKCAGTTVEKILEREYSDLLKVESKNSGTRLFYDQIPKDLILASSISSHLLAPTENLNCLQFSFIRDPYKRLVSAWKFQNGVVGNVKSTLKDYIKDYNSSLISNYQTKLLSIQRRSNKFSFGWEIDIDLDFLFGDNFFLGVVEKFDESMVLLEEKLKKRNINIDLSYPSKANTTKNVLKNSNPRDLSKLAYPCIDSDLWLYKKASENLDSEIEQMNSFDLKLKDYQKRCSESHYLDKKIKVNYL
jgi:hypothetical protein